MTIAGKSNISIGIKRQSALGTAASGSGGTGYAVKPSNRLSLAKAIIANDVVRTDGQTMLGRHGSRSFTAAYKLPLSQGTLDPLFEAGLRGTWVATFDVTNATTLGGSAAATSITTTTSTIVAAAGSWLLQGVTRGMKVKLTGHATAGNNGVWFRVVSVTALTITVAGTPLTLNATPDTTFTLTVAKYLANPTTLIERYHTIDEYVSTYDQSVTGTDGKISKISFNAQPDALIEMEITFMGLDAADNTTGASPVLTGLTYATTLPLVMADGTLRINGVDYSVISGLQWTWDMGGEVPKVLSPTGPDVVLGTGKLSGSFQALSQDLTFFSAFRNETILDMFIDCREPDLVDPKDFTQFYFGKVTLSGNTSDIGQTGALVESVPWNAGIDDQGTDHLLTSMLISSSAP